MIAKAQIPEGQGGEYEIEIDKALLTYKPGEKVTWKMPERLWNNTEMIKRLILSYQDGGWKVDTHDGQGTYSLIFS